MRRRLIFDIPQVVTPQALVGAMLAIMLAAIFDDDAWMYGAGFGLLINAAMVRVGVGLRKG